MKAMILAAGRGERLRPLTDETPKPLIKIGQKPQIAYHLEKLAAAGFSTVIVNTAWLGEKIEGALGDGRDFGLSIAYSHEQAVYGRALETAGGIAAVADRLGPDPFLVISGDVFTDIDFGQAEKLAENLSASGSLAHLILVDNPDHHPNGDFFLPDSGIIGLNDESADSAVPLTFSGIGLYHPALFAGVAVGEPLPLRDLLRPAIAVGRVRGSHHDGFWIDVGTVERLALASDLLEKHHDHAKR